MRGQAVQAAPIIRRRALAALGRPAPPTRAAVAVVAAAAVAGQSESGAQVARGAGLLQADWARPLLLAQEALAAPAGPRGLEAAEAEAASTCRRPRPS